MVIFWVIYKLSVCQVQVFVICFFEQKCISLVFVLKMKKTINRLEIVFGNILILGINFSFKSVFFIFRLFFIFFLIIFILFAFFRNLIEIVLISREVDFFFKIFFLLFYNFWFCIFIDFAKKLRFVSLEQNFILCVLFFILSLFHADSCLFYDCKKLFIDWFRFWVDGPVFSNEVLADFKLLLDA